MECPACKDVLIALEYDEVEVDYCDACHGVWLDAGELELLLGGNPLPADFLRGGDNTRAKTEKPRRCPRCRRKMEKHTTSGANVLYDECPAGHGMWFDHGELQQILESQSNPVTSWLKDIFSAEISDE